MRRAALLVACALSACASPAVDFTTLPEQPIAFAYRSLEQTERMVDEVQAQRRKANPGPEEEFDMNLEGFEKLSGVRSQVDVVRDQQGRLALYRGREARFDTPSSLPRGARPLDWSDDHTRLLFTADHLGASHLFEWIVATGEIRQLTSGDVAHGDGCYGPDGALAWLQIEASGMRIWVRRPGEEARPVTPGPSDVQPACSPDGRRLVYTHADRREGTTLRWVDLETGQTGSFGRGRSAAFSPDGEWIVYSGRTAAGWRLFRMRADGAGRRRLGSSGFEENDPSVSPDGRFVVFSAAKDEFTPIHRLFVRSFDGADDRQLVISGSGFLPVW